MCWLGDLLLPQEGARLPHGRTPLHALALLVLSFCMCCPLTLHAAERRSGQLLGGELAMVFAYYRPKEHYAAGSQERVLVSPSRPLRKFEKV